LFADKAERRPGRSYKSAIPYATRNRDIAFTKQQVNLGGRMALPFASWSGEDKRQALPLVLLVVWREHD
jgi:hypothetical protein